MDAIAHAIQIPPSREQAMVKTKLDEALLWLKELENTHEKVFTDITIK